jgi:putative oxidoreductase
MTTATMPGAARRSRGRNWRRGAMWVLQSVTAASFAAAGSAKLWGTAQTTTLFDAIDQALGIGPWLRYAIGLFEVVGAVALLDIDAAGFAAVALSFVTFGAIVAHLLVLHTNPVLPTVLFAAMLLIVWTRRDELLALVRRPDAARIARPRASKQV